MLVVVKKPRTKKPRMRIEGEIPAWIITGLRRDYGDNVDVRPDEEYVRVRDTDWWKEMERTTTPGNTVAAYRSRDGFTRKVLAEKIGVTQQRIYEMEKGRRGISKDIAKKLAKVFHTSPASFI